MPVKKKGKKKPCAYLHADYLSLLGKTKNKHKRSQLIDIANNGQIKAILECAQNILDEYIPLSKKDIDRLRKHKSMLRKFNYTKLNNEQRKQLLKQNGGFLNVLLPIATSILGSLLGPLAK
jgi:hypothetical protein